MTTTESLCVNSAVTTATMSPATSGPTARASNAAPSSISGTMSEQRRTPRNYNGTHRGGRGDGRMNGRGRGRRNNQRVKKTDGSADGSDNTVPPPPSGETSATIVKGVSEDNSGRRNRGGGEGRRRQRGRGRQGRGRGRGERPADCQQEDQILEAPPSPRTEQAMEFIANSLPENYDRSLHQDGKPRPKNQRQRRRKEKPRPNDANQRTEDGANADTTAKQASEKKKKKRNKKPKCPWRKAIPPGALDPISLDPLGALPYPPFALVVDEPYVPIFPGMWPPQEVPEKETHDLPGEDEEAKRQRELLILKEQWGDAVDNSGEDKQKKSGNKTLQLQSTTNSKPTSIQGRNFNLFDGRVLAFYLVSTLQFIDPLNRRDLTRPELEALDTYLDQHKLGKARVVEAYDDKGVTVSIAGVTAQTPGGRAEILQQEARAILGSFFRGGSRQQQPQQREQRAMRRINTWEGNLRDGMNEDTGDSGGVNSFQRMYAAHERRTDAAERDAREGSSRPQQEQNDTGIYSGEDGGFLLIDDDINPGLRSGLPPNIVDANTNTFHSAHDIAEHHSHEAQAREGNFPSLPSASHETANTNSLTNVPPKATQTGPSKSLQSITKLVKKTDPAEVARQKRAREEAQRKAALSKLNFFDPTNPSIGMPACDNAASSLPTAPSTTQRAPPTKALLERNRDLAMALGVAPSTIRNEPSLTGWARPVVAEVKLDQFGNELNTAQYPDSLLAEAQQRMTELVKLERQWKKFLADDREASYSLKPMDRPTRIFVHEYSDFWRLHTESFDPEGRRYIHCSKLVDTSAPYPLLSDAARKWRGPVAGSATAPAIFNPPPTATKSPQAVISPADGWTTEKRVPLKLIPRTADEESPPSKSSGGGMTRSSSTPLLSMTGEKQPPPRFADLHDKERPKLSLAPRTKPLEMPPLETDNNLKYERAAEKKEAKKAKQQKKAAKQQALLESAFASDDDDDGGGDVSDSSSDWFEDDAVFDSSDDEGM